ncbi:MAG: cytochrome d ubiquinol oxidase subunit II [Limnochordales bacterium]|nr:cytochrome d ubiquinol oxidase subunit II [Limnochordales bacterium]
MEAVSVSSLATVAFWVSAALLLPYAVGGSIEFGAGAFYAWTHLADGNQKARAAVMRFMSPLWETTNVFLIAYMVSMVAFFPGSLSYLTRAFFVAGAAGLLFLVLRGLFFTYLYLNRQQTGPLAALVFGLSGLLAPACFSLFIPLLAGAGPASGQSLARSGLAWVTPLLTVCYTLELGGSFLAYYVAREDRDLPLANWFARAAAAITPIILVLFGLFLVFLNQQAPRQGEALRTFPANLVMATAILMLVAAARWQWRGEHHGLSLALALLSFTLLFITGAATHLPYLVEAGTAEQSITVEQALVNSTMLRALLISLVVGLALILPMLVWLYRVFLFHPARDVSGQAP